MTKITALTADLLSTNVEIYLQDTMNLSLANMDAIVFDMPHWENSNEYFPYKAILHYRDILKDEGIMIGLVENDFFSYDKDKKFKDSLLTDMSILGLIELPDEMFKFSKPKLIIILQKKLLEDKKCFMVKLPSFTDVKAFNESLIDIEAWFEKNNYNK